MRCHTYDGCLLFSTFFSLHSFVYEADLFVFVDVKLHKLLWFIIGQYSFTG